jgi:hypothetical protein
MAIRFLVSGFRETELISRFRNNNPWLRFSEGRLCISARQRAVFFLP